MLLEDRVRESLLGQFSLFKNMFLKTYGHKDKNTNSKRSLGVKFKVQLIVLRIIVISSRV